MLRRREIVKAGVVIATGALLTEAPRSAHAQATPNGRAAVEIGAHRRRELLDHNWLFQAAKAGPGPSVAVEVPGATVPETSMDLNDTTWRVVQLPHDYVVEGAYDRRAHESHGFLPVYPAWYRKHFHLAAGDAGQSVWIDFEGVYRDAHVYLNGQFLGRHQGGYTPFRLDLGKAARYGAENVLAVYVNPTEFEGWWYEGGGIYRHVWLNVADPVHVQPWGVYVVSKVHDALGRPSADLMIQTNIVNESAMPQTCSIITSVLGPQGQVLAKRSGNATISAGGVSEIHQTVNLSQASLWSLEQRNLYMLTTAVYRGGVMVDLHRQRFGIRQLRFDSAHGFFLNERHVELKGTCNHQDFLGVGIGVPDSLWYWRIRKLKEIGCNAISCAHSVMPQALYDACDELGVLVVAENRRLGDRYGPKTHPGDPYKNTEHVATLILSGRNHPSIIIWSLCNEEYMVQDTRYGKTVLSALMKAVHQYDQTRPITCAMNGGPGKAGATGWDSDADLQKLRGFEAVEDLQGCNTDPFSYDRFHKTYPSVRMFGSEIGAMTSDRGVYKTDIAAGYVSAYHGDPEKAWRAIATRPFMAGGFVWTGCDFRGEPVPCGWPGISSHFGLLDTCCFPKDAAMYYKAWWGDRPLVHLLPHWNWRGHEGQSIRVWCYSNCDAVELHVNGVSLGRKSMPRFGHIQWLVDYVPGSIQAFGYQHGALVAQHRIETTGAPAALRLVPDRKTLIADGQDIVPIAASVVDSAGRLVPTANNKIHFSIAGAGDNAGVGNGDPCCHEPNQAPYRSAFNGLCMVLARAAQKEGLIHVTATARGLTPATVRLLVKTAV